MGFTIERYEISFEIQDDMSVKEMVNITFSEPVWNQTISYKLEGDVFGVTVFADGKEKGYTYSKLDDSTLVTIKLDEPTNTIQLIFLIRGVVFDYKEVKHFFALISIPSKTTLRVFLPVGYILYRDDFYPREAQKETDGKRIILAWEFNETKEIPISIKFYPSISSKKSVILIGAIFMLSFSSLLTYLHLRKKAKEAFLKGFDEIERGLIEILSKEKIIFQKKLEKMLGVSKVKISRIIKKLEKRNLVKKERMGRTNKLIWLG